MASFIILHGCSFKFKGWSSRDVVGDIGRGLMMKSPVCHSKKAFVLYRHAMESSWRILSMEKSGQIFVQKDYLHVGMNYGFKKDRYTKQEAREETVIVASTLNRWLSPSTDLKDAEGVELMKLKGMVELRKQSLRFLALARAINHKETTGERTDKFSLGHILCSHFISSIAVFVI